MATRAGPLGTGAGLWSVAALIGRDFLSRTLKCKNPSMNINELREENIKYYSIVIFYLQ